MLCHLQVCGRSRCLAIHLTTALRSLHSCPHPRHRPPAKDYAVSISSWYEHQEGPEWMRLQATLDGASKTLFRTDDYSLPARIVCIIYFHFTFCTHTHTPGPKCIGVYINQKTWLLLCVVWPLHVLPCSHFPSSSS